MKLTTLKYGDIGPQFNRGVSPFTIILFFLFLSLVGLSLYVLLGTQLMPVVESRTLSINYAWGGTSPGVLEQEVTSKLEGVLSSVKGVQHISSVSGHGYGRIEMRFKKGVNMDAIRFEVASLIRHTYGSLPIGVSYPELILGASDHAGVPSISYTLNGTIPPYYLLKYVEKNIRPVLNQIRGIGEIMVVGASPYQWRIELDTKQLNNLGLNCRDIVEGIDGFWMNAFVGKADFRLAPVDSLNETTFVLQSNTTDSVDWKNIPVRKVGDHVVYLGQIAKIKYEEQPSLYHYRVNGLNTIGIIIYPEKDVNGIKLFSEIKEKMSEVHSTISSEYSLVLVDDSTEYLVTKIERVVGRGTLVLTILFVLVLAVSRSGKYVLLILGSIGVSVATSGILYYLLKLKLHWFSLAGITVAFGFIVDNSIMMTHHYRNTRQKKVFHAMLGSSACIVSSLSVIFFISNELQVYLMDFAIAISVNLGISLAVSYFFIPAMIKVIKLPPQGMRDGSFRKKKNALKTWIHYRHFVFFAKRRKWIFIVLLIIAFGIPVHWLPEKIDADNIGAKIYNKTIGGSVFQSDIAPWLEKALGGSFRLFSEDVFQHVAYSDPRRPALYVQTRMSYGCTIEQHDAVVRIIENHVSQYDEVELFESTVAGYDKGTMSIHFRPDFEQGQFPHQLKRELESLITTIGSVDASVYGVGITFSNELETTPRNIRIVLEGYNYDQLYDYASQLKEILSESPRVKDITIAGSDDWTERSNDEYFMKFDPRRMALSNVTAGDFFDNLLDRTFRSSLRPIYQHGEMHPIMIVSNTAEDFNVWDLNYLPVSVGNMQFRISQLGEIEQKEMADAVHKIDQQYHLVVAYNFVGSLSLSETVCNESINAMKGLLPVGYRIFRPQYGWWGQRENHFYLVLLVLTITYCICVILFESFTQAFAIVAVVPVSFIGVFLTFYFFDIGFDQGGFASFVLLSGVLVSSGLYVINDFNDLRGWSKNKRTISLFIKALNGKLFPICLSLIASILSLLPFVCTGQREVFWFSFAAGTIGGLLFSVIGLAVYLPIFFRFEK